MDPEKLSIDDCSATDRVVAGIILMVSELTGARRRMISVAKRVHKESCLGNGISVRASRTELFPADWSPQTTSRGSDKTLSSPHLRT